MTNIIISCITIITFMPPSPSLPLFSMWLFLDIYALSHCLSVCFPVSPSVCLCCSGVGSAAALRQKSLLWGWRKGVPGRDVAGVGQEAGLPCPSFHVSTLSLSMSLCSALLAIDFALVCARLAADVEAEAGAGAETCAGRGNLRWCWQNWEQDCLTICWRCLLNCDLPLSRCQ